MKNKPCFPLLFGRNGFIPDKFLVTNPIFSNFEENEKFEMFHPAGLIMLCGRNFIYINYSKKKSAGATFLQLFITGLQSH